MILVLSLVLVAPEHRRGDRSEAQKKENPALRTRLKLITIVLLIYCLVLLIYTCAPNIRVHILLYDLIYIGV